MFRWLIEAYAIDWWTLAHLLGWAAAGGVAAWYGLPARRTLALGVAAGVAWEVVELFVVQPLLGFREPWYNRWVFDLAADGLGALAGAVAVRRA